jgi:hypothetical protein
MVITNCPRLFLFYRYLIQSAYLRECLISPDSDSLTMTGLGKSKIIANRQVWGVTVR